ncbi:MAG: polysulfide reductase NrfD [Bacteroidales bacterium]|nr:polysulfide reductase NrfD [Bacteroidales bacterium]
MKNGKSFILWLGFLGIFLALGAFAALRLYTQGSDAVFHADDSVPWTLLIASYVFFVLTSTGATIVASLSMVFGFTKFDPMVKRAIFIGLISLVAGFLSMGLELGDPLHMFYYFLTPNFKSPIWWMGAFYMSLLIILSIKFWQIHKGIGSVKLRKILSITALILEIAALTTLGSVFGFIEARPTYFGEFIQVYFLFSSIISGISAIFFFSLIVYKLKYNGIPESLKSMFESLSKIFGAFIGITLLFSIWRILIGLYANRPEFDALHYIIDTWHYRVEIFIGLMVPFAIMIIPNFRKTFTGKLLAAILVFIGLGIERMNMVMLGQIRPIFPQFLESKHIISYFPTFWEWAIAMFSLALMIFLYSLGEKYLKLETHDISTK